MKTDPKTIKDNACRLGYETALKEWRAEIAIGKAVLETLDNRYEFAKEDYY
jgi:hypothetical protein